MNKNEANNGNKNDGNDGPAGFVVSLSGALLLALILSAAIPSVFASADILVKLTEGETRRLTGGFEPASMTVVYIEQYGAFGKLVVNGETSPALKRGDTYRFAVADVTVESVIGNPAGGLMSVGVSMVKSKEQPPYRLKFYDGQPKALSFDWLPGKQVTVKISAIDLKTQSAQFEMNGETKGPRGVNEPVQFNGVRANLFEVGEDEKGRFARYVFNPAFEEGVVSSDVPITIVFSDVPITMEGRRLLIIVGADAKTLDVIEASDLTLALQNKGYTSSRMLSDWWIVLNDDNAYENLVFSEIHAIGVVVMREGRAKIIVGDSSTAEASRITADAESWLIENGYSLEKKRSSYASREDLLTKYLRFAGCTDDVARCADGSYVARVPPTCSFAPCPFMSPPGSPPSTGGVTPGGPRSGVIACTMDALVCPDGSTVGRTGPDCSFPPCPGMSPPGSPPSTDGVTSESPPVWDGPVALMTDRGCSGCLLDGACLPLGTRVTNGEATYCALGGNWRSQLMDGVACQNNYECVSNQCYNAVCTSLEKEVRETKSLLQRIASWLGKLF